MPSWPCALRFSTKPTTRSVSSNLCLWPDYLQLFHTPVNEEFLDILQHTAQISMQHEVTIFGDFNHDILRLKPSHRSCNHQPIIGSVHLHMDTSLLHFLLLVLFHSQHAN